MKIKLEREQQTTGRRRLMLIEYEWIGRAVHNSRTVQDF